MLAPVEEQGLFLTVCYGNEYPFTVVRQAGFWTRGTRIMEISPPWGWHRAYQKKANIG